MWGSHLAGEAIVFNCSTGYGVSIPHAVGWMKLEMLYSSSDEIIKEAMPLINASDEKKSNKPPSMSRISSFKKDMYMPKSYCPLLELSGMSQKPVATG
ncbi:MAG: hypothetical protein ACTTJM_05630 [Bergeyella cardium]